MVEHALGQSRQEIRRVAPEAFCPYGVVLRLGTGTDVTNVRADVTFSHIGTPKGGMN